MAKTPANVDEDMIRGMMKGDIPRLNASVAVDPTPEETDDDRRPVPETEAEPVAVSSSEPTETPAGEAARPRRRKEPKDYASVFLRKREPAQKRQTYIGSAYFTKITEILAVVAGGLSVPTFLDNLLSEHLERYRDEIDELYRRETEKPL